MLPASHLVMDLLLASHLVTVLVSHLRTALGLVSDSDQLPVSDLDRLPVSDLLDQAVSPEGTIQTHLHHTDLLAVRGHVVDDLLSDVADGAHGNDHALSVGSAIVVEELIVGAQLGVDLVHVLLHHGGQSVVVGVAGLAMLEEDVAVFVGAAHVGPLGVQGVLTERLNSVHVAHLLEVLVVPHGHLLNLEIGRASCRERV